MLALHRTATVGPTSREASLVLEIFVKALEAIPSGRLPEEHHFYFYQRELGQLMNLTIHASLALLVADHEQAVALMRSAVLLQDSFSYMEPENHYLPMRQCLGASLMMQWQAQVKQAEAKQFIHGEVNVSYASDPGALQAEIKKVFAEDLRAHPRNFWALQGLQSLRLLGGGGQKDHAAGISRSADHSEWRRLAASSCCELGACQESQIESIGSKP